MPIQQVYLMRHGETEWSLSGQHTGTTDIPLTENGREVARLLEPVCAKQTFALVLTSPLGRARQTCELAGLGARAEIDADLMEWSYGEYEGLTPKQIRAQRPGWMLFTDGCPGGETPEQVGARGDAVVAALAIAIPWFTEPFRDERFTMTTPVAGTVIGMAVPQVVFSGYAIVHVAEP